MKEKTGVKTKSGLATAAMVLGIVGMAISLIPIVNNASIILGLLAVVLGVNPVVKKVSVGKAVAAIILGVLAITVTFAMQASFMKAIDDATNGFEDEMGYLLGEKTEDILANNLDVKIGQFEVIHGDFMDESKLVVTLTNKGNINCSFQVMLEAVDADGNRVESDTIYVNHLAAGQSQTFDAFTYVSSDNIEKVKAATFRIAEISMY